MALAALAALPDPARAAGGCIPPATGGPWLPGGPDITDVTNLGDLRWTGSLAFNWGTGATTQVEHKMLFTAAPNGDPNYGGTLYLYWRSHQSETTINKEEGVRFGFSVHDPANPTGPTVLQGLTVKLKAHATLPTSTATVKELPRYVEVVQRVGNNLPTPVGSPAYLSDGSHIQVFIVPTVDTMGNISGMNWVVTAQIELRHPGSSIFITDANNNQVLNINDTAPAGLFADDTVTQWGTSSPTMPGVGTFWSEYMWAQLNTMTNQIVINSNYFPDSITSTNTKAGTTQTPVPNASLWGNAQFVAPAAQNGTTYLCTQPGLYVTAQDVYKINSTGNPLELAGFTGNGTSQAFGQASNTVGVQVHNTGATVDTSKIHARFKIAPTGSAVVKSNLWREMNNKGNRIICDPNNTTTCAPIYAQADSIIGNVVGAAGSTTSDFKLESTPAQWTPDWSYLCATFWDADVPNALPAALGFDRFGSTLCSATAAPWHPAASDVLQAHQCLLTELYSDNDTAFNQGSAFTNMHLGHASNFSEDALIDSSGLTPIPGTTGRWFYLWVETRNMPYSVSTGGGQGGGGGGGTIGIVQGVNGGNVSLFARRGPVTYDQAAEVAPTLVVHVYHETGSYYLTDGGQLSPMLEAQPDYGYFIQHDGALTGWRHLLIGAQPIGPDFYRVWIPNGGSATVTTTVGALENACVNSPSPWVKGALQQIETVLQQANSPYAATVQYILDHFDQECWDFEQYMQQLERQPCMKKYIPLLQWIVTFSGCTC